MEKSKKIAILKDSKKILGLTGSRGLCTSIRTVILKEVGTYGKSDPIFSKIFMPYMLKYKPDTIHINKIHSFFWWPIWDKETRHKVIDLMIKDIENE